MTNVTNLPTSAVRREQKFIASCQECGCFTFKICAYEGAKNLMLMECANCEEAYFLEEALPGMKEAASKM